MRRDARPRIAGQRITAATLVCAVSVLAGCETYQSEKADLMRGGGQSQRVLDAQQRLDDAQARQMGLQEEQMMAEEELGALQSELREVNRNRGVQEQRLAQARNSVAITSEQEERLRTQLNSQTEAYNDKVLELETARVAGSDADVRQKTAELGRLRNELAETNREIEILAR